MKKVILMTLLAVVAASSVYAGGNYGRQPQSSGARNSTAPTPTSRVGSSN